MRARAHWPQMIVATTVVTVAPALVVWILSAAGTVTSLWAGMALAAAFAIAASAAGSAYWRRHASGDVLFSDLLVWGWLRRRRMERRLVGADELLREAGTADRGREAAVVRELAAAVDARGPFPHGPPPRVGGHAEEIARPQEPGGGQGERGQGGPHRHRHR